MLKRLLPERVRQLRYDLVYRARYYPELIYSLGSGLECPFCGGHFRRFLPGGFDYPVLIEKKVIGGRRRKNVVCPRCHSNARERLMYLYIKDKTDLLSAPARLLHIAPEPQLQAVFKRCPSISYFSSDLSGHANSITSYCADLTRLPNRDDTFDVILCSHVLEHIPDDRKAMRELFRVLKPGGWAMLQVPIALALDTTYENPAVKTEADRIREFGQEDHVRLYALDYLDRLRAAGFMVDVRSPRELGPDKIQKHALEPTEDLYICSKA